MYSNVPNSRVEFPLTRFTTLYVLHFNSPEIAIKTFAVVPGTTLVQKNTDLQRSSP